MLQILLPVGIAALLGIAYVQATKPKKGEMTAERQIVLDTALTSTKDPDKLRELAKVFKEQGLDAQATLLELRAKLRELPPDVQENRKDVFRQAMESVNAPGIRAVADTFEQTGATAATAALRKRAFDVENPANAGAGLGLPGTDSGLQSATQFNPNPGAVDPATAAAILVAQQAAALDPGTSPEAAAAAVAASNALLGRTPEVEAGLAALEASNIPAFVSPVGDGSE